MRRVLMKNINGLAHYIFSFDWQIGSTTISVGGIVSFFFILIVTFSLSKAISNVLQDSWVIKTMPKGTSSGTSMVLRIIRRKLKVQIII